MIISLLCAAALLSDSAADSPPVSNLTQAKSVEQKKVCRVDLETGSIVPKRICKTQAEWDDLDAQARRFLDRLGDAHKTR